MKKKFLRYDLITSYTICICYRCFNSAKNGNGCEIRLSMFFEIPHRRLFPIKIWKLVFRRYTETVPTLRCSYVTFHTSGVPSKNFHKTYQIVNAFFPRAYTTTSQFPPENCSHHVKYALPNANQPSKSSICLFFSFFGGTKSTFDIDDFG